MRTCFADIFEPKGQKAKEKNRENLCKALWYKKCTRKTLMKLTPDLLSERLSMSKQCLTVFFLDINISFGSDYVLC